MAKRKTAKVANLKPTHLDKDQLERLKDLVTKIDQINREIGSMEMSKYRALNTASQFQQQIGEMQSELEKEYGKADVDVRDGKITYHKDEATDKKD